MEIDNALAKSLSMKGERAYESILICWTPHKGWVKLNTNGCMKGSIGNVGYEGFLHDYKGIWIKGFKYNIGRCSAMEAEL